MSYGALCGDTEYVEYLLSLYKENSDLCLYGNNILVTERDNRGNTPLDIAKIMGNKSTELCLSGVNAEVSTEMRRCSLLRPRPVILDHW
jgi:ankyrin repeat protein